MVGEGGRLRRMMMRMTRRTLKGRVGICCRPAALRYDRFKMEVCLVCWGDPWALAATVHADSTSRRDCNTTRQVSWVLARRAHRAWDSSTAQWEGMAMRERSTKLLQWW